MAVTVLMHMKEGMTCPHDHLRNAIDYILDVKHNEEKTKGGLLVGGNAGTDHREILNNMLDTKRAYGKTDGRQGYHFVLSFAKGETDENTAYEVVKEFCEEYLCDNYVMCLPFMLTKDICTDTLYSIPYRGQTDTNIIIRKVTGSNIYSR